MSVETSTLLIVDDEEMNREGLARHLQRHGYEVTGARNGREAIELLGERRFDLVLLDIMMPGMNGLEVLKLLRRVDSLLDLPIIMVTARRSQDVIEALELGANDYLTKPLDLPIVLARIRTQLSLKRAVRQVTELERKLDARNRELEVTAARLAAANSRVNRDLEAGAQIQKAFLPALTPEVPGARFAWVFEPSSQLTGQYLNVFRLDDRNLGLCVIDINGNDIAAALLSMTVGYLLAHIAGSQRPTVLSPAEVTVRLSEQLSGRVTSGPLVTLLYGVFGLECGEFRFVSAGHPAPVYLPRGAAATCVKASGLPIGVGDGHYSERGVTLKPGDRLLFYTDGLTAVRNGDGEHFGMDRLLESLERSRRSSLSESITEMLRGVEGWRGDTPRHDDISLLMVERRFVDGLTGEGRER